MNEPNPALWKPSPELLAAYADGELDARDDAALLRARIEAWVAANPAAQAELAADRRLKNLWDRTTPPLPPNEVWLAAMNRLERLPTPKPARRVPAAVWFVSTGAAAACLLWAILLASSFWKAPAVAPEVFVVAGESDVEILHVDGDAVESLVVGLLPFRSVFELADLGEIEIMSLTGAPRDNMKPVVVSEGPSRPLIWARAEWEEE
jgi:hypothetical protein